MSIPDTVVVTALTIPGYTGFTKEVINEDVLPGAAFAAVLHTDNVYLYNSKDTSNETNRTTKEQLKNYLASGRGVCVCISNEAAGYEFYYFPIHCAITANYGQLTVYDGTKPEDIYTAEYTA